MMMIVLPIIIGFGIFLGSALLLFSITRVVDGKWKQRFTHSCGYVHSSDNTFVKKNVCPKCGEHDENWQLKVLKEKWPVGYKEKLEECDRDRGNV